MPENSGLPAPQGIAFHYQGHEVRYDENKFIDVTEMWRSVESPENKKFKDWKRKDGASFISDLSKDRKVPVGHLYKFTPGKHGGSWAHWQIAIAYAKYLSNDFHRFVNEAFREWAEENANPDLKITRGVEGYKRLGWDARRIEARIGGLVQRHLFTDMLKEHGVAGRGYAICTDAINREVLGASANQIRLARGLSPNAPVRDALETEELAAIGFAEAMARKKIDGDCAHGNGECCEVCRQSGQAVYAAMAAMGLARQRA